MSGKREHTNTHGPQVGGYLPSLLSHITGNSRLMHQALRAAKGLHRGSSPSQKDNVDERGTGEQGHIIPQMRIPGLSSRTSIIILVPAHLYESLLPAAVSFFSIWGEFRSLSFSLSAAMLAFHSRFVFALQYLMSHVSFFPVSPATYFPESTSRPFCDNPAFAFVSSSVLQR